MIHPTCLEVLATIQTGFQDQIVPHLNDAGARSAAATIGHLLRHVALRIEHEGQILFDDIARLEALLERIAAAFAETGVGDAEAIHGVTAQGLPPQTYPSLAVLGERALRLRGVLVGAQERLQSLPAGHPNTALREDIRAYIAAQLADEGRLIAPAFQGRGPRR